MKHVDGGEEPRAHADGGEESRAHADGPRNRALVMRIKELGPVFLQPVVSERTTFRGLALLELWA